MYRGSFHFFLLSIFLFYTIFNIRPLFCVHNFCSCNGVALRIAVVAIVAAAVVHLASAPVFVFRFWVNKRPGHFPSRKILSIPIVVQNMPNLLVRVNVQVGGNGFAPVPFPPESKGSDVFPT